MIVYSRLGSQAAGNAVGDVTVAPGFLTEAEMVARYYAGSGRDPRDLGFHLGLASFKLAAVLEGIHYRFVRGQTIGEGFATDWRGRPGRDRRRPASTRGLNMTKEQ